MAPLLTAPTALTSLGAAARLLPQRRQRRLAAHAVPMISRPRQQGKSADLHPDRSAPCAARIHRAEAKSVDYRPQDAAQLTMMSTGDVSSPRCCANFTVGGALRQRQGRRGR